MNSPTLVVIHMQDLQLPSGEEIANGYKPLQAMERAVKRAVREGSPVVFLELPETGNTHPSLRKHLVGDRTLTATVYSNEWLGARQIVQACKTRGFSLKNIELGGLFTERCIPTNARGLTNAVPGCRINVLKDCCGPPDGYVGNRWDRFRNLPNVRLI